MKDPQREAEELRAGVNCATVLEKATPPWLLDRKESSERCLNYRRGAGEIVIVTHGGAGGGTRTATPRATSSDSSSTSSRASTSARCGRCCGPWPGFDPISRRPSVRATSAALQSLSLRDGPGARN